MIRAVLLAIALLLGACVPPEGPLEVVDYPAETLAGEIQERGVLEVGVDPDAPPFSSLASDGAFEGFLIDLSERFGAALGTDVSFHAAPSADLAFLARAAVVDIALPLVPITEERARAFNFLDPFYVGHQMLLVPAGSSVRAVGDLSGRRVCSAIDETGVALDRIEPSIRLIESEEPETCFRLLRRGEVAAATATDVWLLEAVGDDDRFEIVGDELSTAGFGPAIGFGTRGFDGIIESFMDRFDEDGTWLELYRKWIGDRVPEPRTVAPSMTVEDAAALFPEDLT